MPFIVPADLIAAAVPTGAQPTVVQTNLKAVLCMKWLRCKFTSSKQKPQQRVDAVFEDYLRDMAHARAAVRSLTGADLSSAGRQYGIQIHSEDSMKRGGLGLLKDELQRKHEAKLAILISGRGRQYPVAAYRSGGKGLKSTHHIYLFLPGIGELKPIKPKDFVTVVNQGLGLEGESVHRINILSASVLAATATAATAAPDDDDDEGENVYVPMPLTPRGAERVQEDGATAIAGLGGMHDDFQSLDDWWGRGQQ